MVSEKSRRLMHFFSKPLLLFPCCGSNLHISEPGSRVSPEEQDQLNRVERLRPASLETEEPVSKSEEACDTHPYHCPICFYFFSGASPSAILGTSFAALLPPHCQ